MNESLISQLFNGFIGSIAGIPIAKTVDALDIIFNDRRSFNYAKNLLRDKYEELMRPADYDHVVENIYISRQDFLDYFLAEPNPTSTGLHDFLIEKIKTKSVTWSINRPPVNVLITFFEEYYQSLLRIRLITDHEFSSLGLHSALGDHKEVLNGILNSISELQAGFTPKLNESKAVQYVLNFLRSNSIPYLVYEKSKDHMDIILSDPTRILPTKYLVHVFDSALSERHIDSLRQRITNDSNHKYLNLIVVASSSDQLIKYGENRGVQVVSEAEFCSSFRNTPDDYPIMVGMPAADELLARLKVDHLYLKPDVVHTYPDETLQLNFFSARNSSDEEIVSFLNNDEKRILILLGNYGSGKSALAANTFKSLSIPESDRHAAFVELRNLRNPSNLENVVQKSSTILSSFYGGGSKKIVILDGLDELHNAMDPRERKQNVMRIIRASRLVDKLIVTARLSYFSGLTGFWELFHREGDDPYWHKIAKHLEHTSIHPGLTALVIREFDSNQISKYLECYGKINGLAGNFEKDFIDHVESHDLDAGYKSLLRNPMYLYLLVHTQPWNDASIGGFSDVIDHFVNYWLERDVEKGPSRWLLSTDDRKQFIQFVAWQLFQDNKYILTKNEFQTYVGSFLGTEKGADISSLIMDLQTTGIFTVVGDVLTFALRSYADLYIAKNLIDGKNGPPNRLPNVYEAHMWLGLLETVSTDRILMAKYHNRGFSNILKDCHKKDEPIDISYKGILYQPSNDKHPWVRANSEDFCEERKVIACALRKSTFENVTTLTSQLVDEVRDEIIVVIRMANKLGLHARAAARLISALNTVIGKSSGQSMQEVYAEHGGNEVNAYSIMDVMMLAASFGAEVKFRFINHRETQVFEFLKLITATPEKSVQGVWLATFNEGIASTN